MRRLLPILFAATLAAGCSSGPAKPSQTDIDAALATIEAFDSDHGSTVKHDVNEQVMTNLMPRCTNTPAQIAQAVTADWADLKGFGKMDQSAMYMLSSLTLGLGSGKPATDCVQALQVFVSMTVPAQS